MRNILILITLVLLVFFLFLILVNSKDVVHKQLIKDYSDEPLAKYTLEEWELGFCIGDESGKRISYMAGFAGEFVL